MSETATLQSHSNIKILTFQAYIISCYQLAAGACCMATFRWMPDQGAGIIHVDTICLTPIKNNQHGVQCDGCATWLHSRSIRLSNEEYDGLQLSDDPWYCKWCLKIALLFFNPTLLLSTILKGSISTAHVSLPSLIISGLRWWWTNLSLQDYSSQWKSAIHPEWFIIPLDAVTPHLHPLPRVTHMHVSFFGTPYQLCGQPVNSLNLSIFKFCATNYW